MDFEEKELIADLIKISEPNPNNEFLLVNGFGTNSHGRYFLGTAGNRKYCLFSSFISIFYIPLIPVDYMIGYKKDGKKYVIGTVKWKDLKEYLPSKWKVLFSEPLDGVLIILGMAGFFSLLFYLAKSL